MENKFFDNWLTLIKSEVLSNYALACNIATKELRKQFKETYGISFLYYKIIRYTKKWNDYGGNGLYLFKRNLKAYLIANDVYFTKNAVLVLQGFIDAGKQPNKKEVYNFTKYRRLSHLSQVIDKDWRILKNLKSIPINQLKFIDTHIFGIL